MAVAPTPVRHRRHMPQRRDVGLFAGVALVVVALVLLVQQDVFQRSSSSDGIEGSGTAATQTRVVAQFSRLELAGSNNVTVRLGGRQSVVVRADDNLLRNVTTEVQSGSLVIGTTGSFTTKTPMSVQVTVPSLEALTLSGKGLLVAANLYTPRLSVRLSGSGLVRASGEVTRLEVSLPGSGDVQLEQLPARDVRAVVNGSGRIVVHATGTLDASVPGSGAIVYSGNPGRVTRNVTGSGAIVAQ